MKKDAILVYLKNHKDEFAQKYDISNIALFGSFARDENRDDSDIDIAIDTSLSDYFLLYDFKERLEKAFDAKVDVVRLRENMNPALKREF